MTTGYPGLAVALQQFLHDKVDDFSIMSAGSAALSKLFEDDNENALADIPLGKLGAARFATKTAFKAGDAALMYTANSNLITQLTDTEQDWRDTTPDVRRRNMDVISRRNAGKAKKIKPKRVPKVNKP